MQLSEWNKLQKGDVIRHTRTGSVRRRKIHDRTIFSVRDGTESGRYITLTNINHEGKLVEYPAALAKNFTLVMKSTDTAKMEIRRISSEMIPSKVTPIVKAKRVSSDDKLIMVHFSISGVSEKPISAEFTINNK